MNPAEKLWTFIAREQTPLSYTTIQHSECPLAPRCCHDRALPTYMLLASEQGGTSPLPGPLTPDESPRPLPSTGSGAHLME